MLQEDKKALSRRGFLKLSSMVAATAALAACVPAAAPGSAPAASGGAAAPAAQGATVTYWYAWGNLDPAMAKIVETEEFKKHMNGAKLEYKGSVNGEAMLTSIAGGNPPDCHSNHDYVNYFARGAAIPVQDMASASSIVKKENMLDWVWDYSFFDGQMIGVPGIESYVQYGLDYNIDAAEKAGLDTKNPPRTWAETLDWHKKLTKKDSAGNLTQLGLDPGDAMGGDVDFGPLSYGVTWYDEKTKEFHLDDERITKYLNDTSEFIRFAGPDQFAGMRQVEGNGGWGAAFEAGIQTMIIEGYWHPGETTIHKPEIGKLNRASWAPMSDDRKDVKMQAVNAHFVQILKDGKNHDGAFKLGEFFNTVKACEIIFKEVGWIHGVKEYVPTVDANAFPGLKFYIDSAKEATEWHLLRRCPIHGFVANQLTAIREQVFRDKMKPAEAAAELQKRALAEFEAQGLKK
jgi:ABC-type glycerol-3-phosphate transport system substrate-binding protein